MTFCGPAVLRLPVWALSCMGISGDSAYPAIHPRMKSTFGLAVDGFRPCDPVFNHLYCALQALIEALGIRLGLAIDTSSHPARSVKWFAEPQSPKQFPPADLTPSKLPPVSQPRGGEEISYGALIHIGHGNNDRAVGDAIHAVLAACLINQADLLSRTEKILESQGVDADAAEIAAAASASHDFIQARFQPQEILVEVPFSHWNADGQRIAGNMDLVLMTNDGAVLIDHKSYRGSDLVKNTTGYSGQVAAYRDALAAHGHPVRSAWIHYCSQGKLVQFL